MNRMLLVRHAHAFDHEASDPGLDPVGRRQAAAIAKRLAGEGVRHLLSSQVLAAPPAAWMQLPAANASLTELELRSGGEFAVVAFNDVGHLRDASS